MNDEETTIVVETEPVKPTFAERMKAAKAVDRAIMTRRAANEEAPVEKAPVKKAPVKKAVKKAPVKKVVKPKPMKAALKAKAPKAPKRQPKKGLAKKVAKAKSSTISRVKPKAQIALEGAMGPPTIARSYRRAFSGTGATQRGNMLQVTVTFTPEQFDVLKERADLYNSSLSEAIRKCVAAGPLSVTAK